jgi:alpha-amylase
MNTESLTYNIISKLINFRKDRKLWKTKQVQRYADDEVYAFSRDDVLCLFTNTENYKERTLTYHPYKEGTKLCNLFNGQECIRVQNKKIKVTLGGDYKVYVPKDSLKLLE